MLTQLHVVTSLFNPWRYQTRGQHYQRFRNHVKNTKMCELYVGELAFGRRPFEYTSGHHAVIDDGETHEFQFRTDQELWHKERMLNRLVQELPNDWEYMAWVDADLQFARDDWALETVHLLQHYDVVQMFSHSQNLDSHFGVHRMEEPRLGFVYSWEHGIKPKYAYYGGFQHGHPGFAWAFRREAFEKLGGFMDIAVLGAGDLHMALSMTGQYEPLGYASPGYTRALETWDGRCQEFIKRNVGYVPGLVNHYYHGSRRARKYNERWQILQKHGYDPELDLKLDSQGLYQWTSRCPDLEYDIRRYFATRHEDLHSMADE